MANNPMKIRASAQGEVVDVRVLIGHIMETGQRKDSSGKIVPAHFIQSVKVTNNGKPVLMAQWGPAVSKDPVFGFKFKGGKPGDKIAVTWTDNHGDTQTQEATIS